MDQGWKWSLREGVEIKTQNVTRNSSCYVSASWVSGMTWLHALAFMMNYDQNKAVFILFTSSLKFPIMKSTKQVSQPALDVGHPSPPENTFRPWVSLSQACRGPRPGLDEPSTARCAAQSPCRLLPPDSALIQSHCSCHLKRVLILTLRGLFGLLDKLASLTAAGSHVTTLWPIGY